ASGNFSNDGTIEVTAASTLVFDTDVLDNTGGTVLVDLGTTLDLNASTIDNGTVTNHGTLEAVGGSTSTLSNLASGNFSNDGTIEVTAASTLVFDTDVLDNTGGTVLVDLGTTLD